MPALRHPQFCPVARVGELLGQRWVLLVLRELFVGPQRFSDLRRRLSGVSPSVLAERLASLEAAAMVQRRELPPPAATTVYELSPLGRAFEPAFLELVRFGARLLDAPQPGDHTEPDWMRLAVMAFGRRGGSPARRIALRLRGSDGEAMVRIAGGPDGTRLLDDDAPVDVTLTAPVAFAMALMSGAVRATDAIGRADVSIEGDVNALLDLPDLFEIDLSTEPTLSTRPEPEGGP